MDFNEMVTVRQFNRIKPKLIRAHHARCEGRKNLSIITDDGSMVNTRLDQPGRLRVVCKYCDPRLPVDGGGC